MSRCFTFSLAVVFSMFLLVGCARTTTVMFHGWHVQESMPLASGEGQWETFDVNLQYQAQISGDKLSLSGRTMLTMHYHLMYTHVTRFSVYLFLVDDQGAILQTVPLLLSIYDSTELVEPFDELIDIPEGATGMAFGYRGDAFEFDSSTHFSLLPKRPAQ